MQLQHIISLLFVSIGVNSYIVPDVLAKNPEELEKNYEKRFKELKIKENEYKLNRKGFMEAINDLRLKYGESSDRLKEVNKDMDNLIVAIRKGSFNDINEIKALDNELREKDSMIRKELKEFRDKHEENSKKIEALDKKNKELDTTREELNVLVKKLWEYGVDVNKKYPQ